MDELDQLAIDIHAFLFQNIFDATLQNDGTLIQGNKVYCHRDKDGTVLPVVVKPALCDYQGKTHEISLFCNIREKNEIIEENNPFLPNLFLQLQIRLRLLQCSIEDKNNTPRIFYHHQGMRDIVYYFIRPSVTILDDKNILIKALSDFEKELFRKDNLLKHLPFDIVYDETSKDITTLIRNTNSGKCMTTRSLYICFLLNIINCILQPLCKLTKNVFFPPSKTILELSPEKIINIQHKVYITQDEYNEQSSNFSFREYKYTAIQLSPIPEVINTNLPAVSQSPNPLPVAPANPYYPYTTQVQPNPYFFLPTQYGNQYYPPYSYQNIPSLIVTIPPINQRTVNYELTYKWINEQYTKTNHKDQFESELLFLYRVEFELLKIIKKKENIHPFNLDRPLFTIFSSTPEDVSKNKPHAIQLRPFDFYSYKLNDSQTTIYDKLSEQQKEIINISYALENPSQLYSQEAEKFKQMNAWGTLYLLHYLLYQQTGKVEHDWESMIAIAQEVAERFAISTDEVERHIIPEDINDERLYSLSPINNRGDFSDAMEITPKERTGKNDEIYGKYKFAFFIGDKGQSYYHALKLPNLDFFIPEIFVSVSYLDFPVPMLLPPKIHHLLNGHLVDTLPEPLEINPNLTEAVSSPRTQLSWWGGKMTIDKVDLMVLKNREVICICHGLEDFETSLKVCSCLNGIAKAYYIRLEEHHSDNTDKPSSYKEKFGHREFPELAEILKYNGNMHGFQEGPEQEEEEDSVGKIKVVKDCFSTKELILLLGEPKVGKTFVGLSLALSIASGTQMHEFWKTDSAFKGDVYYCYGEMTAEDIDKRLMILAQHMHLTLTAQTTSEPKNTCLKAYAITSPVSETTSNAEQANTSSDKTKDDEQRNLFTVDLKKLKEGFDITNPDHNEQLTNLLNERNWSEKGLFIVFDNYFVITGSTTSLGDAKFNKAFKYFNSLMKKGACIMLCHHTNSEGEIAATQQFGRMVDGVIRLTSNNIIEDKLYKRAAKLQNSTTPKLSEDEFVNILTNEVKRSKVFNIYVTYLYFRHITEENLIPLHMSLDTKDADTSWQCEIVDTDAIIQELKNLYYSDHKEPAQSSRFEQLKELKDEPEEAKKFIVKTIKEFLASKTPETEEEMNNVKEMAKSMSLIKISELFIGNASNSSNRFTKHVGEFVLKKGDNKAARKEDLLKMIEEYFDKI
ncbi:MAG: AAA family ATPase [Victivallales bacterium]|nr:AAA family ATPase [Victivallales bacterium]